MEMTEVLYSLVILIINVLIVPLLISDHIQIIKDFADFKLSDFSQFPISVLGKLKRAVSLLVFDVSIGVANYMMVVFAIYH